MQIINLLAILLTFAQGTVALAAPRPESQTPWAHNTTVVPRKGGHGGGGGGHGGGGSGHGGGKGSGGGAGHSSAGELTPGMTVWIAGLAIGTVVIGGLGT